MFCLELLTFDALLPVGVHRSTHNDEPVSDKTNVDDSENHHELTRKAEATTDAEKTIEGEDGENIFAEKETAMDAILEAEEKAKTKSELRLERAMNKHRENRVALMRATAKYPGFVGSIASWYSEKRSYLRAQLIHYGPPYQPDYGGNLPEEISKDMNISSSDVHAMLNEGADPNVGSVKDINNTPLHYVARWGRLRLAKMLFEAGADPNKQNEFGVTPLGMACIFNQGESEYHIERKKYYNDRVRRKRHTKLIKYLIQQGAKVDHIDRGGHTAIEHAAFHGNMDIVTILLQNGAKTYRATEFLSLIQPSPLDYAWKGNVKHILTLRNQVESDDLKAKKAAEEKKLLEKLAAEEYEKRYQERRKQRQEALAQQKRNRVLADREKAHAERVRQEEMREKQRKIDMMLKQKHEIVGRWEMKIPASKGSVSRWEFIPGTHLATAEADLMEDCDYLYRNLGKKDTNGSKLKKRWKHMTGIKQGKPQGPEEFAAIMSPKYKVRIPKPDEDLYADLRVSESFKRRGKGIFAGKKGRGSRSPKRFLPMAGKRVAPAGRDSRHE